VGQVSNVLLVTKVRDVRLETKKPPCNRERGGLEVNKSVDKNSRRNRQTKPRMDTYG